MKKLNWIIVWHDRHRDDIYQVVTNATCQEASEVERQLAVKAGWENETEAKEHGYGEYGYGEDYFINLIELDGRDGVNKVIAL